MDVKAKKGCKMKDLSTPIPQYRAKKINSDEYVEGFLIKAGTTYYYIQSGKLEHTEEWKSSSTAFERIQIDPSTLAIHFPDMLDGDGNRIFASLREDGKGGDILEYPDDYKSKGTVQYKECLFFANGKECHINHFSFGKCKAIGIQK